LYNIFTRFRRWRKKVLGKKLDNQDGLTLLEVLLSIVILTIILTSFAGFFSQSAMFVKKNEEKLNTSQTAQQIVNLIEVNVTKNTLSVYGCNDPFTDPKCSLNELGIETLTANTIDTTYNLSAKFSKGEEGLVKVKVEVIDPDNPESSSETFTYIRR
jgi:prepilin-type N-terminal cleavage/methylation domain-containing protein